MPYAQVGTTGIKKEKVDGWMDGRTDGRTGGWVDGWIDSLNQASLEPQTVYTRGCLGQQESNP
jgi:hypothetical protein